MPGGEDGQLRTTEDAAEEGTALSRATIALREREATYRGIIDSFSEAVYIQDAQGVFIDVNKGAERMYGYSREELIGMSPASVSAEGRNDLDRVREQFLRAYDGESQSFEFWGRARDGREFLKEVRLHPIDYLGRKAVAAVARDITAQRQAEQTLRESEERFRSIYNNIGIGVALIGRGMEILSINPQMQSWFPHIKEGSHAICYSSFNIPPRDRVCSYCPTVRTLDDGQVHDAVTDTPSPNGTRHYKVISTPLYAADGSVSAAIEMVEDITEQVRTEQTLRESESAYRTLAENVPDIVYRVMLQGGGMRFFNDRIREITGYSAEELERGNVCSLESNILDADRPKVVDAVRQAVQNKSSFEVEYRFRHRDGTIIVLLERGAVVCDSNGAPLYIDGIIREITERQLLEEERHKTQKLESIGTLAGGIAHDFNNLLQGIFGYISMAKMTIDSKEKAIAMLDQAEKALHQSVNLTTQLLTFAKGGKPVKSVIDLRPIIENAVRFTLSGSRCDFRLHLPERLWHVEADEGQMGQVIQNIVMNADQAMPVGGTVVISAENVADGDRALPTGLAGFGYVLITIKDEGVGIPEKYLDRIFDPYFTTKEKGSGLGLATSYSIVRHHAGAIEVKTHPGEGSAFLIYLPAVSVERGPIVDATPPVEHQQRKARVLVMDDEQIIRDLSGELIAALGHEVEVARHGQEAISLYQAAKASGRPFDIVILDLTVRGGMGGAETMQQLLMFDPSVKAIVSSGYSDDASIADHLARGFKAYLKKPYDVGVLRDTLSSLLC